MVTMMIAEVLYKVELNDRTLLVVSAELPTWAPRPSLEIGWLRQVLVEAIQLQHHDLPCQFEHLAA